MRKTWPIENLDCPNCAAKLAANMEKIDGINAVKINFLTEKLIVETDAEETAIFDKLIDVAKKFSKDIEIKA